MKKQIGLLLFPELTLLDLTGPLEVLRRCPDAECHVVWKTREPVRADSGLGVAATTTMAGCPALDVLFVPGGYGQIAATRDDEVIAWLKREGGRAEWVTSACTGSLLLGAAGLLRGYRATTHWAFLDLLPIVGATPVSERVVVDRNRMTAGGVTSGIDFGLELVRRLAGEHAAKSAQLELEYDPAPPFAGHPDRADPAITDEIARRYAPRREERAGVLRERMRELEGPV